MWFLTFLLSFISLVPSSAFLCDWITVWFLCVLLSVSFGWETLLSSTKAVGAATAVSKTWGECLWPCFIPSFSGCQQSGICKPLNPLVRHRLRLRAHPLLWTALKSSLHLQSSCPARVLGSAGWHWEPWAQPSSPTPPWEGQNSTETPSELFLTEVRVVA